MGQRLQILRNGDQQVTELSVVLADRQAVGWLVIGMGEAHGGEIGKVML